MANIEWLLFELTVIAGTMFLLSGILHGVNLAYLNIYGAAAGRSGDEQMFLFPNFLRRIGVFCIVAVVMDWIIMADEGFAQTGRARWNAGVYSAIMMMLAGIQMFLTWMLTARQNDEQPAASASDLQSTRVAPSKAFWRILGLGVGFCAGVFCARLFLQASDFRFHPGASLAPLVFALIILIGGPVVGFIIGGQFKDGITLSIFRHDESGFFNQLIRTEHLSLEIVTALILAVGLLGFVRGFDYLIVVFGIAISPLPLVIIGTYVVTITLGKVVAFMLTPWLSLRRFKTIICRECLRFTNPRRSRYQQGMRYCEHCQQAVEDTREPGKVIVMFGKVSLPEKNSVFVLADPDMAQKTAPIDVSEVYLDPQTTEQRLLERFITYMINYPPSHGVQSVRIFYRNELDDLGDNLKNALRNTFRQIERMD